MQAALLPSGVQRLQRLVLSGLAWGLCSSAWAQEAIYRCGNEYTNAPVDVSRCERLAAQAVTVIPGVRPLSVPSAQAAQASASEAARSPPAQPLVERTLAQKERDAQARTILVRELEKVQKQHQVWVQTYNQGAPEKLASELAAPITYTERVAALKAAIDRAERDINSLQRELASRPVAQPIVKP